MIGTLAPPGPAGLAGGEGRHDNGPGVAETRFGAGLLAANMLPREAGMVGHYSAAPEILREAVWHLETRRG